MNIKSKIKKHDNEIKYSIVAIIFIVFVFIVTITFLEINLKYKGTTDVRNNYYDIKLLNPTIDYNTTSTIKIDNDTNTVSIKINDLNIYTKGNSFNIEMYNIGNIDATIGDIIINNIDTNVDKNKVDIKLSVNKNDSIDASEKKMLNILIKYNEIDPSDEDYFNFNINFYYREIVK
jgi:hypothetical protein